MLRFAPFESVATGRRGGAGVSAKFTFVQCPKYFAGAEDEIFSVRASEDHAPCLHGTTILDYRVRVSGTLNKNSKDLGI